MAITVVYRHEVFINGRHRVFVGTNDQLKRLLANHTGTIEIFRELDGDMVPYKRLERVKK